MIQHEKCLARLSNKINMKKNVKIPPTKYLFPKWELDLSYYHNISMIGFKFDQTCIKAV